MKILMTGGTGFIGKHLITTLYNGKAERPFELYLFRRNENIDSIMDAIQPDVVFHLAGNPLIKTSDIEGLLQVNTFLTHRILKGMKQGSRMIFASSAAVYGDYTGTQFNESQKPEPTAIYGYSKLLSENLIEAYTLGGKIKSTILRLGANVGPGATHGVLKDLLEKYHNNDVLEVIGDAPGSSKPYTFVKDTATAFAMAMDRELDGVYNVAVSDNISVRGLVYRIFEKYGEKPIKWLGESANWKGDNRKVDIAGHKIRRAGWNPVYKTSSEAIRATLSA